MNENNNEKNKLINKSNQNRFKEYNDNNPMIRYFCTTEYYCINCRENFKCIGKYNNKNLTKKDYKQKWQEICSLCEYQHLRCDNDQCNQCCEKSKCNEIECNYCKENNFECKRSFPITQEDFDKLKDLKYSICQFENGGKMNRLHLQGYGQFKNQIRRNNIKKIFNNKSLHIELAKGSYEEASNYCQAKYIQKKGTYGVLKEENYKLDKNGNLKRKRIEGDSNIVGPFEFGNPIKHRRTISKKEMNEFNKEITYEENKKLKNLLDVYEKGNLTKNDVKKYMNTRWLGNSYSEAIKIATEQEEFRVQDWQKNRWWKPVVFYFYGDSGAGKTGLINELFNNPYVKSSSAWWDNNYNNEQDVLLIDEFYTKLSWGDMLNVLNDISYNINMKYTKSQSLLSRYIFLTGSRSPNDSYNFDKFINVDGVTKLNPKTIKQLERRLDVIIRFEGDYNEGTTKLFIEKDKTKGFEDGKWDIKYKKRFNESIEEIKTRVIELNKNRNGEVLVIDDEVYWREKFNFISYLKEYVNKYKVM